LTIAPLDRLLQEQKEAMEVGKRQGFAAATMGTLQGPLGTCMSQGYDETIMLS
jgi:hypothetical protein